MYSALIVEDELFALHSMRDMLDWNIANIGKVYEAANGKEAYEVYLRERPDIILTDLCMPVMDGLTLIRNIREKEADSKTRIIIMTCLNDFAQAQQALNMGVSHYFLKATASCRDIQEILQTTTKDLDKDRLQQNSNPAEKAMQVLKHSGSLPPEDAAAALLAAGISSDEEYAVLLLRLPWEGFPQPGLEILQRTVRACSRADTEILHISPGYFALLLNQEDAGHLSTALSRLCAELSVGGGREMLAGMSGRTRDPGNLAEAMRQAGKGLDLCFFTGVCPSFYVGQEGFSVPEDIAMQLLALPNVFLHIPRKFVDSYETRIRQVTSRSYPDSRSFKETLSAVAVWLSMQTDSAKDSLEENCVACTRRISESETLRECVACFEQYATDILNLSSFSRQMPDCVKEALQYIYSNLDHPLSLNEIAEHIHLNPAYLSTLFRRVMNQSPISYINSVRIERAKLLLRSTNLSVSEIAASLGFSQDIYFYRLFKHFTQVTPSEYRSSAQWQNGEAEQRMPETRYGGTLSMDRRQTPIKADPATIP
ncbi:helix-turn-helix domain-containing protein [uncultured Acetatifactor sp.]|uniref:response regulator transcription factor n=1 Tax=uncultured Acetatifactor sp. TaxID=1671927 RepID=UPI002623A4AD|nr:helix-turn-helix domain-containing protein [uncultured Acetatifactor sp.]